MKQCKIDGCDSTDLAKRSAMCREHHREYVRNHYESNKQVYLDKANRHFKENLEIIRSAKSVPCLDCGVEYPYYVMDFDHLGEKSFNIGGSGKNRGRLQLLEEIAKCDVVCANCHRERTASRVGYQVESVVE